MIKRTRQTITWGAQVGIRVDEETAKKLDAFCAKTHRSRAQVARMAIEQLLQEQQDNQPTAMDLLAPNRIDS